MLVYSYIRGGIIVRFVVFFTLFCMLFNNVSIANTNDLSLNDALRATYTACIGIDDSLHELKVLAGVNTAVTSVGTAAGAGATATGFIKQKTDNKMQIWKKLLQEMRELSAQYQGSEPTTEQKKNFLTEFNNTYNTAIQDSEITQESIDDLNKKSKTLGNWRTGLLAANTATNIAGAVISSQTINKDDIQTQINTCISATKNLSAAIMQARINGEDVSEAENIYTACNAYEYIDIDSVIKRGTGAMVAASVGAGLGGIGTITSSIANSQKIRDENSDAGKKKEKDFNTTSNVMSVGATVASTTATVFNATQIAAIKRIASVSEKCTGILK